MGFPATKACGYTKLLATGQASALRRLVRRLARRVRVRGFRFLAAGVARGRRLAARGGGLFGVVPHWWFLGICKGSKKGGVSVPLFVGRSVRVTPRSWLSNRAVAVAPRSLCFCSAVRSLRILRFRFSEARSPAATGRRRPCMGRETRGAKTLPAVPEPGAPGPKESGASPRAPVRAFSGNWWPGVP